MGFVLIIIKKLKFIKLIWGLSTLCNLEYLFIVANAHGSCDFGSYVLSLKFIKAKSQLTDCMKQLIVYKIIMILFMYFLNE